MTKAYTLIAIFAIVVAASVAPQSAHAQATQRWIGGNGDWTSGGNWDINGIDYPDSTFDGELLIENDGIANVNGPVSQIAPEIFLGTNMDADEPGNSGTLNINAGGVLSVGANPAFSNDGGVTVGNNGGVGILDIANGGSLDVVGPLRSETNANFSSKITLNGTASLSTGPAFLDRQLQINGFVADFNVEGSLVLGLAGNHAWEIGAGGAATTISVTGNADLGGTLRLFSNGYQPAIGDSFTLIDSATVDFGELAGQQGFGFVDTSGLTLPNAGADFRTQTSVGGDNGTLTMAVLEQRPVLVVNRETGNVSISNPGTQTSIDFDAYSIRSNNGSLVPAAWQTLQAAAPPTGSWFAANPQSTGISELNVGGSSSVGAGQSFNLGNGVFNPPTPSAFGVDNEDLRFQIGRVNGELIEAAVVYEGMPNNTLVLNVNPSTGAAQLLNPTAYDVAIDSYVITSRTGSLNFANGSPLTTWRSLQDSQIAGNDWFEANVNSFQLSELQALDTTDLDSNFATLLDIGTPFNSGGTRDLVFRFALAGESFFRTGTVVYSDLVTGPPSLVGDYNGDGFVDAADYTVWRDTLGQSGMNLAADGNNDGTINQLDYGIWRANFGNSQAAAAVTLAPTANGVPEPATTAMLAVAAAMAACLRRQV